MSAKVCSVVMLFIVDRTMLGFTVCQNSKYDVMENGHQVRKSYFRKYNYHENICGIGAYKFMNYSVSNSSSQCHARKSLKANCYPD